VLPARAMAKVSFRLVPDQDPSAWRNRSALTWPEGGSGDVTVEVVELHGGRPWRGTLAGPLAGAATLALRGGLRRGPGPGG
jgi:acetylornithine deacetylase/succinyl-diaminopimelate desuccinylase-like protein